eukprot:797171_1
MLDVTIIILNSYLKRIENLDRKLEHHTENSMATTVNQAISLHIKDSAPHESAPLELEINDDNKHSQMEEAVTTETPIKNVKCMAALYILFICCSLIAIIIQFSGVTKINLILFVNTSGGILLILWIIYQFHDSSFGVCFMKRDLYLPLLFHVMDTSSDLATTYIYYYTYKETLQDMDEEEELFANSGESGETIDDVENESTTTLQLFFSSIFILFSYRIVSSFIIYLHTKKYRLCCLQCLDLYIYEILIKSWQLQMIKATLLQLYISQLESYFESFPQLLINLQFITETISLTAKGNATEDEDVSTLSLIFVIISGFLSITSVAIKARKSDERFFKPNANIREMKNQNANKKCCLSWKYFLNLCYRYCDVWYRAYALNVIWYNEGSGFTVIGIIIFDFFGAVIISSIEHKTINFDLIPCIAITPIVSSNKWSVLLVFWYRIVQNVVFLYLITFHLTNFVDQLLFPNNEGRDSEFFPFMLFTEIAYVFITVMSFVYYCDGISDKPRGLRVIKKHSVANTQRFEGIENPDELVQLIQFGYVINADDIQKANYVTMSNIIGVYHTVIGNIKDQTVTEEYIEAWKSINNATHGGNLLHQFCKNNCSNDIKDTLQFIIKGLAYDVNEAYNFLTPLMIAAMYQGNAALIKLLIQQYNADVNACTDNRSALYYAHKYNKSTAKDEIIELLRSAMRNTALPLPGQVLVELTFDLKNDLEMLKAKYGDKYQELLPRAMMNMADGDHTISVMQFNVLADGLSGAYSKIVTEKTFLNVDKECLQWTYRGVRLVEEIVRFKPDIIGLQECDQLPFLMKYLKQEGYESHFQIKTTSSIPKVAKALSEERKEEIQMDLDGVALIYRADKFEMCGDESKAVQYIDSDNIEKVFGLAVQLKQVSNEKSFLCVVTHLKSTKTKEGEEWRERQINLLLTELVQNDDNVPVIVCCDLNSNPIKSQKGYDALCYNAICDGLGYESVYKLGNGVEPEYTTLKMRESGMDKHVLDYIFIQHDNHWKVNGVLDVVKSLDSEDDNAQSFIPNWCYPSDHFSVFVQLNWN